MLVMLAALQIAPPTYEWVWADISINDGRGVVDRIEILPKVAIEADRRVLRSVVARRTSKFAGKTTNIQWTDASRCPRLRESLDSIGDVKVLAGMTLSNAYEGPAVPLVPSPHRQVATVKIGAMTMTAVAGSPLGLWVQDVATATSDCWKTDPPEPQA